MPFPGWAVKVGGDGKGNCAVFEISLVAGVQMVVGHLRGAPEGMLYLLPAVFGVPLSEYCVCMPGFSGRAHGQCSPLGGVQAPNRRSRW